MATYYLDFENGNDASAGTSWATAWNTLNNGATAARIAPGDEIRIAKTADPVSIGNATWTKNSATVTLATAQTANIYLDGSWTAANSGTATTTTTRKEGSNASSITTAATTATSTKYAYLTVGGASGLDLSSYDAITFWIQNASIAISANNYQIKLCSDTTGDTAVDTFNIPDIASTAQWVPLTLKRVGGGNLGNAIKSIAWYTGTVSPGNSRNVFIDDVLGCTNSGLNLTSLISKNSAAFGGTDTWHGLMSINGTTVILGMRNSDGVGSGNRGYWTGGTSPDTVTTYVRPTYKFATQSSATAAAQPLQDSGSAGSLITYSGGWDTTSNTQNGETWIDGQNGFGNGLSFAFQQYIKIERFGITRFFTGVHCSSSNTGCEINTIINNCDQGCRLFSSSIMNITVNNCSNGSVVGSSTGQNTYNVKLLNNGSSNNIGNDVISNIIYNNNGGALTLGASPFTSINYLECIDSPNGFSFIGELQINEAVIKNMTTSSPFSGSPVITINKLTASGNSNVGILTNYLSVKQTNALSTQLLGSGTSTNRTWDRPVLRYSAVNNVVTDNRSFWAYGNALSQTTTRKSATGIAWQINITNALQTTTRPIYFPIAKVACNANSLVTVKAWVKLSHATDIGAKLMIQANEIAGVSADVTATKSADTNWEELQITFTPTIAGVAQIYVQGYWLANLADESIFVDDVTVTQA